MMTNPFKHDEAYREAARYFVAAVLAILLGCACIPLVMP